MRRVLLFLDVDGPLIPFGGSGKEYQVSGHGKLSNPFPEDDHDARIGLHWKTRRIIEQAAGLPFVWIDDETTDTDRTWCMLESS
jgi:hypothetical protein